MAAGLLAVAPVDGVSLTLTGADDQQQELRSALVDRLGALQIVQRARK